MRIGLNDPQDFMALLVRRKWWVLAPFIALTCLSSVFTYILPRTYVSEVLILVRPRDVPKDFVRDLIAGSPEERLKAIEQTILSRTNLIQILREFGANLPEFDRLNLDDKVVKLRDQIAVIFEVEKRDGKEIPLNYFRITYQNQNPELAQKIAGKLTSLFLEQDNRTRETQVFGTTEFLTTELDKLTEQLNESETKIKQVKSARQFELPDQRESNLRTLDRLGLEKKTNLEALDRFMTVRLNLESEISQTPPTITKPTVPFPQTVSAANSIMALKVEEFRKAKLEYEELASRYTPKHPDVQSAKARMERLKKQVPPEQLAALEGNDATETKAADGVKAADAAKPADAEKTADTGKTNEGAKAGETAKAGDVLKAGDVAKVVDAVKAAEAAKPLEAGPNGTEPNPLYQRLISQLNEVKTELDIRQKEKASLDAEVAKYTARVESAPAVEQDMADLIRQNDDLRKQYNELKTMLGQARMSESLESKQKGSQFQIIDPANYPLTPDKPKKILVILAGLAVSLLISVSIAVVTDIARQKVWTQSQVEALWGVPVLVDIPEIVTDSDVAAARKKKYVSAAYSVAGALAWSLVLGSIIWKQGFLLNLLDPVLQKVVYK